jgi:thiamine transporter ThiT
MKVMGSAILVFQAIVIGLTVPVAVVLNDVPKSQAIWTSVALIVLCFLAVGGVRRDRRTAVTTGLLVQVIVLVTGIFVRPMLFPGVLFLIIWLLAINLSAKTDAAIAAKAALKTSSELPE